jgi:error-prone DNA polymerase
MTEYAELHCHSYYSLLDGAAAPEALVERAAALGLRALALTDHDSLAGAVRFGQAAQQHGLHPIFGAEVTLAGGAHLTLLAETQTGYANLCRLLTAARLAQLPGDPDQPWPGKVEPRLTWEQIAPHTAGLIALSGCRRGPLAAAQHDPAAADATLAQMQTCFGPGQLYIELQAHRLPDDRPRTRALIELAARHQLPLVVTHNAHYTDAGGARLRDVLIATSHNCTLRAARQAGKLPNSSRYALAGPTEMASQWASFPQALAATVAIAERCQVSLDFSGQRLPHFPTPDHPSEFACVYALCHAQLPMRYPDLTPRVLKQLAHELDIIERAHLAGYFLLVWDIVRFAKQQGIRCQGRGSAANSIVAYLLGITSIDPLAHNLLFERFLAEDRFTMPDIDIDFAADRREEVIQYVYQRYGRDHAAMACNVVTYRARSAIRDIGKALDLPPASIDRLCRGLDTYEPAAAADQLAAQVPADAPPQHPLRLLVDLLRRIDGCPRHLSIHSGGMVITHAPLAEVVPLEPATLDGRIVCQWDKDSLEDAGLVKIDLLSLRTLGLVSEALTWIAAMGAPVPDLDQLPLDDPAIFALLGRADTIGAFQVESRAQQQMLPRLRPTRFEEMAVEIAIVRPGPIQGGAVHPYLRRRRGEEPVRYLHPSLEPVLAETLGVLLFQEQAIRVAMAAADFSPGQADLLRRTLSRSRPGALLDELAARFVQGATAKGLAPADAQAVFAHLRGFAGYGFCKSHAASFALIAYHTLHLKLYHAPAFYCALLNAQPMGFYSPEVVIGDAQRHGVDLLPPDIHASVWRYALARTGDGTWAIRMGLAAVKGLGEAAWAQIDAARQATPFADLADLARRAALPRGELQVLIRGGSLDIFGARRTLLWALGELADLPNGLTLSATPAPAELPPLSPWERTLWDYELLGLSPAGQMMLHYRPQLRDAGIAATWEVKRLARAGQRVRVGGMVVVRQRPGTAKGMLFMSLEDESGLLDLVVRPAVYARLRPVLRQHPLLIASGLVQRVEGSVSVLVLEAIPLTAAPPD